MQPRLLKHPARLAGASLLRLQDDKRLVALAREGHDPAFAAIVDRYGPQLERYCARLLNDPTHRRAEDAVQQAFVNAHAAMRASDSELALKPWLYRIAHNAALNILRAARGDEEALDEDRAGAAQTADVVELRERLRETLASIQALPAVQRDALILREVEGRSHEEIAAALGVTAGGARQHLHRARVSLRAAASAITPYPLLTRVLSAAAAEGGRSGDLVSGAGLGVGAGAVKAAAGVLAAGAIAGGAVTVHHHTRSDRATASSRAADRSTTAPGAAEGPSAAAHDIADDNPPGARPSRGDGRGRHGARGHRGHDTAGDRGRRHGSSGDGGRRGDDPAEHEVSTEHHGTSGGGGTSGGDKSSSGTSGSGTSGTDDSHSGSGSSGSGSDDVLGSTTTATTDDSSSASSGSDDGLTSGSSGSGSGETTTTTTTTTTETDNSGPGGGSGDVTPTDD